MTKAREEVFTVSGQRVTVVGAARSGIAAAELLVRRGARAASVNTQERNERALRLYEHLGFTQVHPGLAVLRAEVRTR